jgi:hypothetical protein
MQVPDKKRCAEMNGKAQIRSWVLTGLETENDCAGEASQQLTRLSWRDKTPLWREVNRLEFVRAR